MSEERKEASNPEYQYGFNTDEGYREVRGRDMSTVGPGPGNQKAVLEGDAGSGRNRMVRGDNTPEQNFRSVALKYLEGAYRSMEMRQRQTIVDQALEVPNYQNLFMKLLVATIYFRQLTPELRNRSGLSEQVLNTHAGTVLTPLLNDRDTAKIRQKKVAKDVQFIQLKADLLRYLRYILPL